jgi:hypothetical protein
VSSEVLITVPRAKPSQSVLVTGALPPDVNVHALMEYRLGLVRRREFKPLGVLEKFLFEAPGIGNTDARTNPLLAERGLAAIDWRGTGPLVGMSLDRRGEMQDALICSPVLHPPELPEPGWKPDPRAPAAKFVNGIPIPPEAPTVPQRIRDRAAGILPAETTRWRRWFGAQRVPSESDFYFVVGPVTQIVLIPADKSGIVDLFCSADSHGRHTTFLYNPHRAEGHFIFGSLDVQTFPL